MVEITEYNNNNDDDNDKNSSESEKQQGNKKKLEPAHVEGHQDDTAAVSSTTCAAPPKTRLQQQQGLLTTTPRLCDACGLGPRDEPNYCPLKRCSICHQVWYHDRNCQRQDFARHKKICKQLARQRQQQQQQQQQQQVKDDHDGDDDDDDGVICRVEESSDRGRYLVANNNNSNSTTGKSNKKQFLLLTYGTVVGPHNTTSTTTLRKQSSSSDPTNTTRMIPKQPHNNNLSSKDDYKKEDNNNNNNSNNAHWKPIVAPVLLENHRRHRCVVCFGLVADASRMMAAASSLVLEKQYPTRLCSDACRRTAASFLPSEQQAIAALYQSTHQHPPRILPTAVLLFRLVLATERDKSGQIRDILKQLQSEPQITSSSSQEEEAHRQAVCATTWAMIRAMTTLPLWHLEDLNALLNQIKLNGFSVCTGESVALGIGIYTSSSSTSGALASQQQQQPPAPNLINHNCRPNLLQTFDYGVAGRFPTLQLTICVPHIADHEELTISYIDPSLPRRQRQSRLKQDYGFLCRCQACDEEEDDDDEESKSLEDRMNFLTLDSEDVAGLEKEYQFMKQRCRLSSWYVHECGERLLQALLDDLGNSSKDAQRQYCVAAQAYQLTEELLQYNNNSEESSLSQKNCFILKRTFLRYKGIKLRLFLNVQPTQAIQELEQIVFPVCATFFPSHHEIMRQIVQDLCL
jgi:hypothetical protein